MEKKDNLEAAGFRELAEALPMMIWTATPDGVVDYSNQAFSDYTGVPQEAPSATRWQGTLHPDDLDPTVAVWTRCVREEIPYSVEFRIRRDDGVYRWFHCQARPVRDAEGRVVNWYGTAVDIDDARREQEELRLLRSSIAKSDDVVLITKAAPLDEPGPEIVFVNEAFKRNMGYTAEEALGRSPRFLQGRDTSRETLDRIRAALGQGKPIREELLNYDKQGNPHWIEIAIEPVSDEKGRLTHFISVQREISGRKKAEQERTRLIHELRERVKELKAMHEIATLLRRRGMQKQPLIEAVAEVLAEGMQWPEFCGVLVSCGGLRAATSRYGASEIRLEHKLRMADGQEGLVRVMYTGLPDGAAAEHPFLDEERVLVRWVAETLCAHFELRATEEALRASEERFRLLSHVTTDVIWDWNVASGELWWNEGYGKLFGYDREQEGPGLESWTDHIHPEDRDWVVGTVHQTIESGESDWTADYRFLHRDGHVVRVLDRGRVIRDSAGKPVHMIGGMTDITELVRLREQYDRILKSVGEGIHGLDTQGNILFENPAGAAILGWSAEDLVGRHSHSTIHHHRADGSEYPVEECPIYRTLRDGKVRQVDDEVFFHKDGTPIPVKYSCAPMRGAAGEIIGAVVCFSDVSEQRRTAERIREQAALLDQARDAIIVRDLEHRILFWNHGAERLYGWTRGETGGRRISELLYKDTEPFARATDAVLHDGQWTGELRQLTRDGTEIVVEARWTLLKDQDGKPKSILAINSDITERRRLEAQFLRAQRMESIGTLAGGIAHDLNNVLTPILMSVDLLKQRAENEQSMKLLDSIHTSTQRGARMISQILSFARGYEGRRMDVKVGDLISELEAMVRETFPKNIALAVRIAPEARTLHADPTQIHQVLLNLLVNSRDAMPDGGRLLLSAERVDLDADFVARNMDATQGPHMVITVEDTGCGMDRRVLERLFDPFFTTKEHGKGTGLGMSTSLGIVKSHGGFIRVYSEPGSGTSARVYLPITCSEEPGETLDGMEESALGADELVLIVEDEAAILELARQTLEAHGYRALAAESPAAALALAGIHRDEIKLIVTDMILPDMGAGEMVNQIRDLIPGIRVVATSGFSERHGGARADAFLSKPYTTRDLLQTVRRALDQIHAKNHPHH